MKHILQVQTDDDFGIEFKGKVYSDYRFTLTLDSLDELDDIKLLGPFGTRSIPRKTWEFEDAVGKIRRDPLTPFNTRGGNRGVNYFVLEEEMETSFKLYGLQIREGGKAYYYKTPIDCIYALNDQVVVELNGQRKIVKVVEINCPQDPTRDYEYKSILGKFTPL
jgi:hypothetical protein